MTVRPKVTSSELSGLTRKRANSHCIATPSAKNTGAIDHQRGERIEPADRRELIA